MVVATAVFFSSCGKTTIVTLTVNPDSVTAGPGQVVAFSVVLTPDVLNAGTVGSLDVTDGNGTSIYKNQYSNAVNSVTDSCDYTIPNDATIGSTISINFTATDGVSGKTNTVSATIKVGTTVPTLVTYTGKTVSYDSGNGSTDFGWQLTGTGVNITTVNSADADLCFFFNDTRRQQIWSPDAKGITDQAAYSTWTYSTTGKKSTLVQKYTGSKTFEQLTADDINGLTVIGTVPYTNSGYGVELVAANDIYIFQLSDGRKGAFKVSASNPPYTKSPAIASSITLDFSYQQSASSAK